ncbi:hypothetical protein [Thalassomonas actiniarum]|uniref:Uncharacterized protein n=1 Tax=Thalassomonas actiniarum TaxID=485447 RepID=A0AAF0C3X1_9GAMM|nr:hypothetical protein [Thalassomonas actiniarum]WDD99189.1 hypothetical protein SG35_000420 [Thalassomonas actiniarum]
MLFQKSNRMFVCFMLLVSTLCLVGWLVLVISLLNGAFPFSFDNYETRLICITPIFTVPTFLRMYKNYQSGADADPLSKKNSAGGSSK